MYGVVLNALGGIGVGIALSVPSLWTLVFFSLIPLVSFVYKDIPKQKLFLTGWLFGTCMMGSTLYWFFNTLPLDWLGIANPLVSVLIVFAFWAVLSVGLGVVVGVWTLAARLIRIHPAIDIVTFSVAWMLFEYVRMWMYTVVTYGPGSVLEPFFSFGFVGYALAHNHYTLQIAAFGGVFVLSLVTVAYAMLLRFLGTKSYKASIVLVLVVVVAGFMPASKPDNDVLSQIQAVETNTPSRLVQTARDERDMHTYITEKLRELVAHNPDVAIVVLPEFSNYTKQLNQSTYQVFFEDIFENREVILIDSERVEQEGAANSTVVFFSTTRGELDRSGKQFFLPAGEYMPHLGRTILSMFGLQDELQKLTTHRSYARDTNAAPFVYEGVSYIALTCSDAVSPLLYKQLSDADDKVLINASSLAWFHHAQNPRVQFMLMAKVHAVWNNAWYVQATNAGPSFKVAPSGYVYQ